MGTSKTRHNEGRCTLVFYFYIALSLALLSGCFSHQNSQGEQVVMVINGHDIKAREFADRLALRLKNYDALKVKDAAALRRAKEETAQSFVLEAIAHAYADKQGIKIERAEVDARVEEIRKRYPDDFAFRRQLASENLSLEQWKKDLEFSLLQRKIALKIQKALPEPTEAEMQTYYDANKASFQHPARVRLRQVVTEKEEDARRLLEEVNNGADMAQLARKFSVAPEAAQGGDTGWIEKGTLEVFDQAFKLPASKGRARSKVIKSPYGYHIYEVLQKEPEGHLSFQEAKARIRAQLMEHKEQSAFAAWLEEQVRKASVKRNDALIDSMTVSTRGS